MFEVRRIACGSEDLGLHNTNMSTGSLTPILVLFTSKMQALTFWYILHLCESPLFALILDN